MFLLRDNIYYHLGWRNESSKQLRGEEETFANSRIIDLNLSIHRVGFRSAASLPVWLMCGSHCDPVEIHIESA